MLVVPVAGDKSHMLSSPEVLTVKSYTCLKSEPAVYVKELLADGTKSVFISEIININGVRVEYDDSSKLLTALGPLRRKFYLPQPGDKVEFSLIQTSFKQEKITRTVEKIRFASKHNVGKENTLEIICGEAPLSLRDVLGIQTSSSTAPFDHREFLKYYFDYLPLV